jgi:hypothetical protein
MQNVRTAVFVVSLSALGCSRSGESRTEPAGEPAEAAAPEPETIDVPVATVEFHDHSPGVTVAERSLVKVQEFCVLTQEAQGRKLTVTRVKAEELVVPRRTVRAYYNRDRMAWYQEETLLDIDQESCQLAKRVMRRVRIVRDGEAVDWSTDGSGPALVERLPLASVPRPMDMQDTKVLKKVAGQDCVIDSTGQAAVAKIASDICYWARRPPIRNDALEEVALYIRGPALVKGDPDSVWEAVEIVPDVAPPAAVFEGPFAGKEPDPTHFAQARAAGAAAAR